MIFVGIDWSEAHHDVCVMEVEGRVLTKARVPDGVEGVARLHEVVATHAEDPSEVVIGIEIDRGLLVGALVAAGYAVHAINPLSVAATGTATGSRGQSPTQATLGSWRTSCGPTGTCTGR